MQIAHIVNGHVGYRRAERGIPYLSEMEWLPKTPGGNLELQAMEFDADSTAARNLVNTVKALTLKRGQLPPGVSEFYQDPARALFDVGSALCVTFRLFGDSRMNGVDLPATSHPPMRWRQMQTLNMIVTCVAQFWDSSLTDAAEAAFSDAIENVEGAFELITGSARQVQGLHDAWGPDGWDYAATVVDRWNSAFRAKVAKYAYIEPSSYSFDLPGRNGGLSH